MGYLRAAVGVALIAAPRATARLLKAEDSSEGFAFLIRTIGIRDLVLGIGIIRASSSSTQEARHWLLAGLVSDSLDAIAGTVLVRTDALAGAMSVVIPLPVIVGDVWALLEAPEPVVEGT
ncbi:MAG: hypothetical protein ACRD6W_14815 [Nitrososphaerales archaeon]